MESRRWIGTSPQRAPAPRPAELTRAEAAILRRVVARLDAVALGFAVGVTGGIALALATFWLVVRGGVEIGPRLALLANYFPGFAPTPAGALFGFVYTFIAGFGIGWLYASLWNLSRRLYVGWVRTRSMLTSSFLDNV